ncbi:MAG TPA: hypothetical protein VF178_09725 [Gemmatimonadaceae bacterium]
MALFKTDDTDWRALYFEERAKVDRLTQTIVRMKKQGYVAPPEPKPQGAGQPPTLPSVPGASLDSLKAALRAKAPTATDAEIEAEAKSLAAQVFPN